MIERRTLLRTAGAIGAGSVLAGCSEQQDGSEPGDGDESEGTTESDEGDGDEPESTDEPDEDDGDEPESTDEPDEDDESNGSSITEVDVGPEGRLRYDPDAVEISVGDAVRWIASSEGHNVTSHPDASPRCENPDGADPFTSYEGDDHFAIMDVDETFEHEFTVPGEYVYVCTPHDGQGMVGTVTVTE